MAQAGLLICFAILGLLGAASAGAQPPRDSPPHDGPVWRIVLMRSWDSLYPLNIARESALRAAILEGAPRVIEFYPEEIDPLRFEEDLERDYAQLLARKYKDVRIDVVIPSGIETLEFVARHRDTIWPGAATVFNGVWEGALDDWELPPRTTGSTLMLDLDGTLALGRALVPGLKNLHVVSGSADFDLYVRELTLRKLERAKAGLEVHLIGGLSRAETVQRLSTLGAGDAVLYLSMLRDADGQLSGPTAPTMALIAGRSPVPVLSVFHTQFRRGPVGGSAPRVDHHGQHAGRLVRRVLAGEDAALIPISMNPEPNCEVDWNALTRWKIPERSVPARCAIANRPPSIWVEYFWPVVGLISIIVLQAALIHALLLQSRRRRRAEAELHARSAELAQVARLSMVGALTASIAHEINQPMGAILANAEAAEMMLEQGTLDPDKLREILADIRTEDLRASEVIGELRKLISRGERNPVALDVNAEVAEALGHVAFQAARRGIQLSPVFAPNLPAVDGVAVQLQQVIINLVMNAMEALETAPAAMRDVRVETLARSDGVEIVVADHGPGLADDHASRLFETLFTTKRNGMGFGLAIVRKIVEEHRGRVSFERNVPSGAIFRIWLPAVGT